MVTYEFGFHWWPFLAIPSFVIRTIHTDIIWSNTAGRVTSGAMHCVLCYFNTIFFQLAGFLKYQGHSTSKTNKMMSYFTPYSLTLGGLYGIYIRFLLPALCQSSFPPFWSPFWWKETVIFGFFLSLSIFFLSFSLWQSFFLFQLCDHIKW